MNRRLKPRLIGSIATLACLASAANGQTIIYTGPSGGSWGASAFWDLGVVPDQGWGGPSYTVLINGGGIPVVVIMNVGIPYNVPAVNVDRMIVDAGDELLIPDARLLQVNQWITNNGLIRLEGNGDLGNFGAHLALHWSSGPFTLGGSGEILMATADASVEGTSGGPTNVIHEATHTIEGFGRIGANMMQLDNRGLIDANVNGETLLIDLHPVGNLNSGEFRASNGGILSFLGGFDEAIDNTGGLIATDVASRVEMWNYAFTGGMLDGEFHSLPGGLNRWTDLDFNGVLRIPDAALLLLRGTIRNDGSIVVESTSGDAQLGILGDTLLTGTGSIHLTGTGVSRLDSPFGIGDRLTNDAQHLIRGSGIIGAVLTIENRGVISAMDPNGPLVLSPRAGLPNSNSGQILAASGATLRMTNGVQWDNTGGIIAATVGSLLELDDVGILGGVVQGDGPGGAGLGEVRVVRAARLTDVTVEGFLRVTDQPFIVDTIRASGTLTNNGSILYDNTTTAAMYLVLEDALLIDGSGQLRFGDGPENVVIGTFPFTNGPNHTLRGSLVLDNRNPVINHGVLIADGFYPLRLMSVDSFTNHGELLVRAGSELLSQQVTDDFILNEGRLAVESGGLFNIEGQDDYRQITGETIVNGEMRITLHWGRILDLRGGHLHGEGLIVGDIVSTGGVVSPGQPMAGTGDVSGTLTISRDYTQLSGARLHIDVEGSTSGEFDVLRVTRDAMLDGVLSLGQGRSSFVPSPGDAFTIITADEVVGTFALVEVPAAWSALCVEVTYTTTEVIVSFTGAAPVSTLSIVRGTHLGGGIPEIEQSDDQRYRVRSGIGNTFVNLHSMILEATLLASQSAPFTLDLRIESRLVTNQGAGTATVRLYNWNTNQFNQIGVHALGSTDQTRDFNGLDATKYVRGDGRIVVQIEHRVVVPVFAFFFNCEFDQIRACTH